MANNQSLEEMLASLLLAKSDTSDTPDLLKEEAEMTRVRNKKETGSLNHKGDLAWASPSSEHFQWDFPRSEFWLAAMES